MYFIIVFRCNNVDYLLIKFEPTGEFNLKSSYIHLVNYDYIYPLIKLEPTRKFELDKYSDLFMLNYGIVIF